MYALRKTAFRGKGIRMFDPYQRVKFVVLAFLIALGLASVTPRVRSEPTAPQATNGDLVRADQRSVSAPQDAAMVDPNPARFFPAIGAASGFLQVNNHPAGSGQLTKSQLEELERLEQLDPTTLTQQQQNRLMRLRALEMNEGPGDALSNQQRLQYQRLRDAEAQGLLDAEGRRTLTRLQSILNRNAPPFLRELRRLEGQLATGTLSPRDEARLVQLREQAALVDPLAPQVASDQRIFNQLQRLYGRGRNPLTTSQQGQLQRLQRLERRSAAQDQMLQRLQSLQQQGYARALQKEYAAAQQAVASGRRITPQQRARLQELQQAAQLFGNTNPFSGRGLSGLQGREQNPNLPRNPQQNVPTVPQTPAGSGTTTPQTPR